MDNVTQTEIWLCNEDDDDFNPPNWQSVLIIGFVKFIFFWQYAFRVSDVDTTDAYKITLFQCSFLCTIGIR